jgi:hypothetical protein
MPKTETAGKARKKYFAEIKPGVWVNPRQVCYVGEDKKTSSRIGFHGGTELQDECGGFRGWSNELRVDVPPESVVRKLENVLRESEER